MPCFNKLLQYAAIGARADYDRAKEAYGDRSDWADFVKADADEIDQMLEESLKRWTDWTNCDDFGVVDRFYNGKIQVVSIPEWPNSDQFDCFEITDLNRDLSQGSGNVISRYFYVPAIDILLNYVDC